MVNHDPRMKAHAMAGALSGAPATPNTASVEALRDVLQRLRAAAHGFYVAVGGGLDLSDEATELRVALANARSALAAPRQEVVQEACDYDGEELMIDAEGQPRCPKCGAGIILACKAALATAQPEAKPEGVDPHGFSFPEYARFFLVDDPQHADSSQTELEFGLALGDRGKLDVFFHAKTTRQAQGGGEDSNG